MKTILGIFPQFGHFYTLHVCTVIMRQSHISNLRLSRLRPTVLTQTILIRYEFNSVTTFVLKEKIHEIQIIKICLCVKNDFIAILN